MLLGFGKTRTFEIFKTLATEFPKVQIITISGKNAKMKEQFDKFVEQNIKKDLITVIEFSNQVPELMAISDLVITKPGGLTSSESLASGLPIIIINPIPGQEEQNAEFLENSGAAVWLKKEDNISEVLHNVLDNKDKLEKMKNASKTLAKPDSTTNICKTLFKFM